MLIESTELISLQVYTQKGRYLGLVQNVLFDMEGEAIYELILTHTNPEIIESGLDIAVPYRWVDKIGEVVMLRFFPGKIKLKEDPDKPKRIQRVRKRWDQDGISREEWR